MLVSSDVVGRYVGEDAAEEFEEVGPVPFDTEARDFDGHGFHAVVRHLPQQFLGLIGLRGGVDRRHLFPVPGRARRADEPCGDPGLFQDGLEDVGDGGLALGAGDADDLQVPRRVAEEGVGQFRQCHPGVFHHDDVWCFRYIAKVCGLFVARLEDEHAAARVVSVPRVFVAVGLRADHADEEGALHCLAGVIDDIGDVGLKC